VRSRLRIGSSIAHPLQYPAVELPQRDGSTDGVETYLSLVSRLWTIRSESKCRLFDPMTRSSTLCASLLSTKTDFFAELRNGDRWHVTALKVRSQGNVELFNMTCKVPAYPDLGSLVGEMTFIAGAADGLDFVREVRRNGGLLLRLGMP